MANSTITEQQFTNSVLQYAKAYGWRCFHVRTSGRMDGRTAIPTVQGDKGFPDLVLVRPPRLIFAELKVGKNRLSNEQSLWLMQLEHGHVECYVWMPPMWDTILSLLARTAA